MLDSCQIFGRQVRREKKGDPRCFLTARRCHFLQKKLIENSKTHANKLLSMCKCHNHSVNKLDQKYTERSIEKEEKFSCVRIQLVEVYLPKLELKRFYHTVGKKN